MDEPITAPEPPSNVSEELVDELDSLSAPELRSVLKYVRSRVEHLEAPISELVEAGPDEEIVRIDEYDFYTVVVKGQRCEDGCEDCPHDPHVYVVTIEPNLDDERHLHWEDLGGMLS